jgi:hypothetical protein
MHATSSSPPFSIPLAVAAIFVTLSGWLEPPANAQTTTYSHASANAFGSISGNDATGETSAIARNTYFAGEGTRHYGEAAAGTLGFFSPSVSLPHRLSNLGAAAASAHVRNTDGGNVGLIAQSGAQLQFSVTITRVGGAPAGTVVPVDCGLGTCLLYK